MRTKRIAIMGLSVGLVAVAVSWVIGKERVGTRQSEVAVSKSTGPVSSLPTLLSLPVTELEGVGIARMNLLCAQGLLGAEGLDMNGSLAVLDEMAARVKSETERHFYRFQQSPAEFENSEGYYRMLMLAVVLAEDFKVHYAPDKIGTAASAQAGDGFFADAQDVFLHGLTGSKRQRTCSSLPVLQVVVGRRLGYPRCEFVSDCKLAAATVQGIRCRVSRAIQGWRIHPYGLDH